MGVEAVLGPLPAAALCWPPAAWRLEWTQAVVAASEKVGAQSPVSQSDPEMERQL